MKIFVNSFDYMINVRNNVYLRVLYEESVQIFFKMRQFRAAWSFQRNCADREVKRLFVLQKLKWFEVSFFCSFSGLYAPQIRVDTILLQENFMRAGFHNFAFVQYINTVCVADGGKAMSDDDGGAANSNAFQ